MYLHRFEKCNYIKCFTINQFVFNYIKCNYINYINYIKCFTINQFVFQLLSEIFLLVAKFRYSVGESKQIYK